MLQISINYFNVKEHNRYLQNGELLDIYIRLAVFQFPGVSILIFYPFKLNGISHSYQLGQSISVLRIVGWNFHYCSNFDRTFCKQTVKRRVFLFGSFRKLLFPSNLGNIS